jgi:hypothetical protein
LPQYPGDTWISTDSGLSGCPPEIKGIINKINGDFSDCRESPRNISLKSCFKLIFCKHYFSACDTFLRKGKDPDPGCPKTWGSGFPTLVRGILEAWTFAST